jgi:hypothetical protein
MEYNSWEDHQEAILGKFRSEFQDKYAIGQREHGGRLWKKPVFPMLKQEAMDFVSYVWTLEDQLIDVRVLLAQAIQDGDWALVSEAFNILLYGNDEGRKEEDK